MKAKQHPLIIGTIILTATGFVTRFIGFFYRIYLSRLFGEEGMGIYQLVSPILSLSFSLTAAAFQTAISKMVAEQTAGMQRPSLRPLVVGISISLPLSLLCNAVIYCFAEEISISFLSEPRTAGMLRILSFSVPPSAVHACINGYFYGIKKASVPAFGQLFEQFVRVGCVYFLSAYLISAGKTPSVSVAILGLTIGEILSLLFAMVALLPHCRHRKIPQLTYVPRNLYRQLAEMVMPLTANRIILNFLQSIESVSLPAKLKIYGYDSTTSLSVYGVLTGMAMPFIYFPNAITGSIAVLLLPVISEKYALHDMYAVKKATFRTIKYCGSMGILCMLIFVCFGNFAGTKLFDSPLAGYFITTLGFICPFLYLDITLSSILQGLGRVGHIFIINIFSLLIRLSFVIWVVPLYGITGYLWGILASQLTLCICYLCSLHFFFKKES